MQTRASLFGPLLGLTLVNAIIGLMIIKNQTILFHLGYMMIFVAIAYLAMLFFNLLLFLAFLVGDSFSPKKPDHSHNAPERNQSMWWRVAREIIDIID